MNRLCILLTSLALLVASSASAQQPVTVYGNNSGARQIVSVNGSGQMSITCSNCSGTGVSAVDDATFTPATDSVAPSGYFFDDVAPDSVGEGDVGVGRMSANRNIYVTIRDAAGNERGLNIDANGALAISGSVGISGYTEAETDATITGTAMMWEDAGDTLRVPSSTYPLPIYSSYLPTIQGDTSDIETVVENLQKIEGAAHASSDRGIMLFGVRQDSQVDFGANGDYTPFSITADGELRVTMAAGTGGTAQTDGATFTSSTTGLTPIGGVYDSSPDTCADGKTCGVGITTGRVMKTIFANSDGSLADYATDYTASDDVENTPSGPTLLMERIDSPVTGVGGSDPIAGDWIHAKANSRGSMWVAIDTNDANTIRGRIDNNDGVEESIISAAGSDTRNYITDIECVNTDADTDVYININDGSGGGTVLWTMMCPAGGGNNRAFAKPLRGGANTAVYIDPSGGADTLYVSINGFARYTP